MKKVIDKRGMILDGELTVESVSAANPAANAEVLFTVPAGERWHVKSVSVSCAQGATQTPWPSLIITDGTNTLFQARCGTVAMNAAVTAQCSWAPGLVASGGAADTDRQGALPDNLVLEAGWTIATVTGGKGANTDYGVPRAVVQKLPAAV